MDEPDLRSKSERSRCCARLVCLLYWWIPFSEINCLPFCSIITSFAPTCLFLRTPSCEIAVCPLLASPAFRPFPTGWKCWFRPLLSENLLPLNHTRVSRCSPPTPNLPRTLFFFNFLWKLAPVWLMRFGSTAAQRCHPFLLNKWTKLIVCLRFEILIYGIYEAAGWDHHLGQTCPVAAVASASNRTKLICCTLRLRWLDFDVIILVP